MIWETCLIFRSSSRSIGSFERVGVAGDLAFKSKQGQKLLTDLEAVPENLVEVGSREKGN